MHRLPVSYVPVARILSGVATLLALTYVGLIAVVMSYAAMHVEFAEQVRSDEAVVAKLESAYLRSVGEISMSSYQESGYAKPLVKSFVTSTQTTALTAR